MPSSEDKFSQSIFDFIKACKVEELELCVKRGTAINEVDKSRDKFTPLHYACYYGSLECLHWLLWQGADYTLTTPKGWTCSHIAAIKGHYGCIQALIKNGVSMNTRDFRGQTPAHLASTHGHSHTLQAILRSGADINMQDTNGWTPVHSASYHGRLGCLQFLKTAGGKMDDYDNDGNTPAHLAAMEGNLHCLKYILSNSTNTNSLIAARNDQGDTPKTLAQQFYKDEVVEYLEAVEWDRDHPETAENLAFPAHIAAFNGDLEHIKLLVEQGVISINERDDKGSTIAHKAAGQGHIHILQWLIENGADLKITNQTGETPRDVAKRFSQLAAIKLLQSEIGDSDDEDANEYYRKETTTNSEAKDPILLSGQQKKEAKSRAKKRLEEIEKQINIARSNYIQLGGKLDEAFSNEFKSEQNTIKEQSRTISELQNELEFERIKREKLEVQLDASRQELEKSIEMLKDYETKVIVLERYIQHTSKQETKAQKLKLKDSIAPTPVRSRSKSQSKNTLKDDGVKSQAGFIVRRNSKLNPNYSNSEFKSVSSKRTSSLLNNLKNSQIQELRSVFDDLDENNIGLLSRREIRKAFGRLDIRASDDEIEVVINQMDHDENMKIDFDEFARVMARNYYKKHNREDLVEAFKKYDLNNSGAISSEELRVVLSKMHRFVTREEVDDIIKQVDRNNDNLIQYEEFIDLITK